MEKKILFVTNNNALNNSFGAEQRSNVLLKAFLANGFEVDLVYIGALIDNYRPQIEGVNIVYWNEGNSWKISPISQYLRLLTYRMFPTSQNLAKIISHLEEQNHYEYIVCRYLQFASLAGLYKYADKLILDIDDLPSQSFLTHLSETSFLKTVYRKMMYKSMKNETKRWIKNSKASLFPNPKQADEYGGYYFPNIPAVNCNVPKFYSGNKNILFIGRLDFDPNYKGLNDFIVNCWNQIIHTEPKAKLLIAGKGLADNYKKSWETYHNIEILGFVDDVFDFYNKGNIVISPITVGAGTNIKVIEAISLGKACVLSQFSTKGFEDVINADTNCMVYHDYNECISKIIRLLRNEQLCADIGKKAFASSSNKYSQTVLNNKLSHIIYKL